MNDYQELDCVTLLTTEQVSELTGISTMTLKRWRGEHRELPFLKLGHSVRYRMIDVRSWIESNLTEASH